MSDRRQIKMDRAVGRSISRTEDARLLTGQGRYIEDIDFPGQLHGYAV